MKRGDVIVVHAAAGGVGLLLSQWGKALGAVVIGIVGSDEKAKLAKKNGCKHVLVRGRDPIAAISEEIHARAPARTWSTTPWARIRSSSRSIACASAD